MHTVYLQLLTLAMSYIQPVTLPTSKLMGDNKEFNDSAIFLGVLLIVGGGKLQNIQDPSLVILDYQLLPIATSKLMSDKKELMIHPYFEVFYSLLVGENFRTFKIHH